MVSLSPGPNLPHEHTHDVLVGEPRTTHLLPARLALEKTGDDALYPVGREADAMVMDEPFDALPDRASPSVLSGPFELVQSPSHERSHATSSLSSRLSRLRGR